MNRQPAIRYDSIAIASNWMILSNYCASTCTLVKIPRSIIRKPANTRSIDKVLRGIYSKLIRNSWLDSWADGTSRRVKTGNQLDGR